MMTYHTLANRLIARHPLSFVSIIGFLVRWLLIIQLLWLACHQTAYAAKFSASFKNTDIQEFINTVSKNLNKTVIIDPSVRGSITVRSYDELDSQQYYQFFLSVLEVYGFSVVSMENGLLKVIPSQGAKAGAIPLASGKNPGEGDEVVIRVVPVHNVTARELVPLLRQLNDNAGVGSVVHYDPSNVLLITGRAAVVNRLLTIIEDVDQSGDHTVQTILLNHASAAEVVKLVTNLNRNENGPQFQGRMVAKVVADERTNTILVSGEQRARTRTINMIRELDREQRSQGNTKVIHLKYAKAASLVEVLTGVSAGLQNKTEGAAPAVALMKNVTIKGDEQTNALIITAAPDVMRDLEQVISQLDIRRAQVLVEAIIVEVQDAEGLNLGVQWFNQYGGGTNFGGNENSASAILEANSFTDAVGGLNGLTTGFYRGNWAALFNALATNSQNDILATPSIVTVDNMEAEFSVGQDVPILTGSQPTTGDNIFTSVSRKNVGIKLKVKPQINQGDSVLLEIEQEVSSVAEKAPAGTKDLGASFNTRTVNNAVLVGNGETVVVGGLLDKTNSDITTKVPILGDIPGIGLLFRSTEQKASKRNLMLFIRPTIIRSIDTFQRETARTFGAFQKSSTDNTSLQESIPDNLKQLQKSKDPSGAFIQTRNNIHQFFNMENR